VNHLVKTLHAFAAAVTFSSSKARASVIIPIIATLMQFATSGPSETLSFAPTIQKDIALTMNAPLIHAVPSGLQSSSRRAQTGSSARRPDRYRNPLKRMGCPW
jgi:hypothetical protein